MLTYNLADNNFIENDIYNFCSKNMLTGNNFGFKCEVFLFMNRAELKDILIELTTHLDSTLYLSLSQIVQTHQTV